MNSAWNRSCSRRGIHLRSAAQSRTESARLPGSRSRTIGAAMPQLSEKPRHGVQSWNPAPHPGQFVCNSRTAIGLQFGWSGIVSGTVVAPNNVPGTSAPQTSKFHKNLCAYLGFVQKTDHRISVYAGVFTAGDLVRYAPCSSNTSNVVDTTRS
jgi:hypothetical protein